MFTIKPVFPGMLLVLFLFGVPTVLLAKDLSTLQTAMQVSRDEMEAAEAERDADAKRVAEIETEMEQLKSKLDAVRKKATQSEKRYVEGKKRYAKSQADFDKAWKK